ncbi:MAG: DUF1217 domain-containing protein [Pseudomonadota bacterium]
MTFQPFVPTGGLSGWRFLQSTLETQKAAFDRGPVLQRDLDYFRENIGNITTPEALVSDFRLLSVALGAFGLSEDINSKFLIRTVLEEGTIDPEALSNRLSDKRYRDLSRAFGFGDFAVPNTAISTFPDQIERAYLDRSFEVAVGQSDETMRLALNARRELPALAEGDDSQRTKWFTLMGTAPLRTVMEGALSLPTAFATLPIDRQLEEFQSRAESILGTSDLSELSSEPNLDRLLDRYTAIAGTQVAAPTSPALVLLRGF